MAQQHPNWRGSYPAIVTPFTKTGEIDEELLRANVDLTVAEGAHGMVVGGHNGEAHLMNAEERKRVIAIGVEQMGGRIPVLAGTGGIGTREVIDMTQFAQEAGADGAMIEPPYFMNPKDDDVVRHYAAISDKVDIPIMLYNNPSRVGINLRPALTERLSHVSNIRAIKDSAGDFIQIMQLIQTVGDRMGVFVGPARQFGFSAVVMGAAGFVDALPQAIGRYAIELYDLAVAGDVERGRIRQHQLFHIGEALYRSPGTFPATLKDAMNLFGRPGGYPRPPLAPMQGEDLRNFEKAIRKHLPTEALLTA